MTDSQYCPASNRPSAQQADHPAQDFASPKKLSGCHAGDNKLGATTFRSCHEKPAKTVAFVGYRARKVVNDPEVLFFWPDEETKVRHKAGKVRVSAPLARSRDDTRSTEKSLSQYDE